MTSQDKFLIRLITGSKVDSIVTSLCSAHVKSFNREAAILVKLLEFRDQHPSLVEVIIQTFNFLLKLLMIQFRPPSTPTSPLIQP